MTAISEKTYQDVHCPTISKAQKKLYGPSHQALRTLGSIKGTLAYKGKTTTQDVYVIEGLKTNLLGLPAISALQLAVRLDNINGTDPLQPKPLDPNTDIKEQYPTVFSGLGNLGEEYEIYLKPDAVPHSLYTPRHVPLPLRPKVQDRMEALGVISKVDEPTPWCAGMVVVPKKEGAIRICVDLKPLSENVL